MSAAKFPREDDVKARLHSSCCSTAPELLPIEWKSSSTSSLDIPKFWKYGITGVSFFIKKDKKDGVKFNLSKDTLDLSVNNTNSGDGKETLNVKFDHDLEISFNSRYLIDVASQLDGERVEIFFNDTGSPALIKDPGDFDSIFVVMPMKG